MNEEGIKVSARPILVLTCFNSKLGKTKEYRKQPRFWEGVGGGGVARPLPYWMGVKLVGLAHRSGARESQSLKIQLAISP